MNSNQPAIWSSEVQDTPAGHMHVVGDVLLVSVHEPGSSPRRSMLYAFNLTDGSLAWQKTFEDALVSGLAALQPPGVAILVAHSAVGLLRGDGALVALDAHGETRWLWSGRARSVSAPAIIDDLVCVITDSTVLTLLDLATGAERARINLDASASLAAPLVVEGIAYVPYRGPHLLAVGLDGASRWRYTFPGEPNAWLSRTPVSIGDWLFATASNVGAVVALRAGDGSPLWRVDVDPTDKKLSAPATDGQRLYLGARDGVHALDPADGHLLWRFATERRVEAVPVAAGGVAYAACHDHRLYALDAATGAELWRHAMQQRIEVPPLVTPDGLCIVIDHGGSLTSISRYFKEAERWAAQGETIKQAEALEQHVRRFGHTLPTDKDRADIWNTMAQIYATEGQVDRAQACRREAARLLRLPILALDLKHGGLVRDVWSQIEFIVRNDGFGAARNLITHAEGDQFEGQVMSTREIASVKVGQQHVERLDVRPLAVGDVPLRVRVEYADEAGAPHELRQTIYIAVAPDEGARRPEQTINVIVSDTRAAVETTGQETVSAMTWDTSAIRDLLTAAFSDEELTTLCFDHFRPVYDNLSGGMSKGQKIHLLLDYCTRRDQFSQLLQLVQEHNPAQYSRFSSRLEIAGPAPQSKDAPATSISGGVSIQSERTDIGGDVVGRDKIQSAGGHIIHAEPGATVIVGGEPRTPGAESTVGRDEASLHRQLAEAETNLKLIQERKSQYVLEVDIPLQLIKEERSLLERIAELKRQLGE